MEDGRAYCTHTGMLGTDGIRPPLSTQPEEALLMEGEPFCAGSISVPLQQDRGRRGGAAVSAYDSREELQQTPDILDGWMEGWRDFFL